ncbi:MAG: hypothetical protein K0Q81_1957 [Paenibacillus sp.]|nr:hypothetical protein [Paenibacillus sp.]
MNPITGVMRMHLRDKWSWLILPWLILGSSFIINVIVGLLVNEEAGIYSGGIASIFVYNFVLGIMILPETFAFALGISIRRKDYFLGTTVTVVLMSTLIAGCLLILTLLEKATGGWGSKLHFFHLPYLSDGNFLQTLWIFFILMLFNMYGGLFISSIHRRFGKTALLLFFFGISLLLSLFIFMCIYYGWWRTIWDWISGYSAVQYATWMGLAAIGFAVLSYLLLRRSTVQ